MSAEDDEREIGGRYRLLRPLGRGGMACVWEAVDRKLDRHVALKLILEQLAGSDDARARFERETMAVAKLDSPHIVKVHDCGIDARRPFMVMELLRGETLGARLKRVGRLSLAHAVVIAHELGKALATAHAANIVHRDLKPNNVFLVSNHGDEVVKLFDFGISKALEPLSESSTASAIVGTPRFMSPEQMRGSCDVDARSDLWSLGIILYALLSGTTPFERDNLREVIEAVTESPTPPIRLQCPELPVELDGFFDRALAKDPSGRFATALEMVDAFERVVAPTLPVSGDPYAMARRLASLPPPRQRARRLPPPPPDAPASETLELQPEPSRRKPPPLPMTRSAPPVALPARSLERSEQTDEPSPARSAWALAASAAALTLGLMALLQSQPPAQRAVAGRLVAVDVPEVPVAAPVRSSPPIHSGAERAEPAASATPAVGAPRKPHHAPSTSPGPAESATAHRVRPTRPLPAPAPAPADARPDLFEEPW